MAKLGDPTTKKLTSGRLFYTPTGDTQGAIDLGNVRSHKFAPAIERLKHMASDNGINQVDLNLVKSAELKYEFELDEITVELLKLALLGTAGADVVQASGNIVAESLTANSKKGRTYFAAARGLSAYAVKVGASTKVEGTDYTIDAGSGAITILEGGTIADGSAVTIDYTKAQVTTNTITPLATLRAAGSFRYFEKDQFAAAPRAIHTISSGQIQVMDWGDNNLDDLNKIKVEVLCIVKPTIDVRKD